MCRTEDDCGAALLPCRYQTDEPARIRDFVIVNKYQDTAARRIHTSISCYGNVTRRRVDICEGQPEIYTIGNDAVPLCCRFIIVSDNNLEGCTRGNFLRRNAFKCVQQAPAPVGTNSDDNTHFRAP
ncbi:hypothetical protein SAMN04488050_11916 [Alloyangia pacifica]|uniref:Uncharacterized protein n=1 Tax=Alloyangia pacifica TaxID=311180 RepID=A0A1I6WE63_9RHOB|nr:hypothetical protein SAMN04488050_11916 [Alloyangia pacifica]